MPNATPIPLESHLCFALYSAVIAVRRIYKPFLDAHGITYPQYLVLCVLWEHDGRIVSAIAERLVLEPSTITPLIKRLEQAGLVKRERNPKNERQVFVRLTTKGTALQHKMSGLDNTLLERSGMTAGQILSLNEQVKSFCEALAGEPED